MFLFFRKSFNISSLVPRCPLFPWIPFHFLFFSFQLVRIVYFSIYVYYTLMIHPVHFLLLLSGALTTLFSDFIFHVNIYVYSIQFIFSLKYIHLLVSCFYLFSASLPILLLLHYIILCIYIYLHYIHIIQIIQQLNWYFQQVI